jgi:oligopeptide transport system permease protein
MLIFFIRRLLQTLLSLWVLVTLTFILLRYFPGSPFDDEITLHPSVQMQIQQTYGLGSSVLSQYFNFLGGLLVGDWGVSQFFSGKTVASILQTYLPKTALVTFLSLSLAIVFSLVLALGAQISQTGRWIFQYVSLICLSVPTLLTGPLFILLFGFYWNLLPVALLEHPSSYILPVFVLSLKVMASLSRILESSLRENSFQDDLRTMKSLGVSSWKILRKYNFKKAVIPTISYIGGIAGSMMGGTAMVEVIFALPGLGTQFIEAVVNRDSSLVLGLTLSYGFFIIFFQFLVDLILPVLDPRLDPRLRVRG